mgnify:CR=1 FL=1
MNFIIGGKVQGKLDYALNTFNLNKEDIFNCEKLEDEKEINFEMLKSKKAIYKFHILIKVLLKYNTPENTKNLIKEFDNKTIYEEEVKAGDYVKIHGKLTSESVDSYLDSLLTIFNSFGCDSLDSLVKKSEIGVFNFKKFNHIISHLNEILNKNNTH